MKLILIRFGDLMLKGKNIRAFIRSINQHIKRKTSALQASIDMRHDRTYLTCEDKDLMAVTKALKEIPGIYSFSVVEKCEKNIEDIIFCAVTLLKKELSDREYRFKIKSKRSDKTFPLQSLELTQAIAKPILTQADLNLIIDVHHPEETLHIDVRNDGAYMYIKSEYGLDGYPAGIAGKGLLMLSGGIDSPVAGFLALKQGIDVELFHFESTPLTPLESVQKVIDIASKLAPFTSHETIKLHLVPFTKIHEAILRSVSDSYLITIMRRMMYRIAESFAKKHQMLCIINGESVGQVASQTLESIAAVEKVTTIPILRPVITYDKKEIIKLSKRIDSFDVSIRPFQDCCTVYVPKNPVIKPDQSRCAFEEEKMSFSEEMIQEAVASVITLTIKKDETFDIASYGFDVKEAVSEYLKEEHI